METATEKLQPFQDSIKNYLFRRLHVEIKKYVTKKKI